MRRALIALAAVPFIVCAGSGAQTGGRIALKSWLAEGDAGYWTL